MARVINQNIPSEYEKLYGEIARPGFEMFPGSGKQYTQRRYPFKLPYHPRIGAIDGTPNQHTVRQIFKECANCYNIQPYSGGATPPAVGPRNRSWWYAAAAGSGLWYYDYFMQQTLDSRFADIIPDWCKMPVPGDSYCDSINPSTNYGSLSSALAYGQSVGEKWAFYQSPANGGTTIHVKVLSRNSYTFIFTGIGAYRILNAWDENTITWENKPAIGELLASAGKDLCQPGTFVSLACGNTPFGVRIIPYGPDYLMKYMMYLLYCKDAAQTNNRPYWT